MADFAHYEDHTGVRAEKFFKATVFQGQHLMVGINCLEAGQTQSVHDHADADKVYVVLEGKGYFTVGDEQREAGRGELVWAAAGVAHGVENRGAERLVLLVNIAPPPGA